MANVTLITYTPEPEKTVAAAAKLCYSPASIDTVMDGLTEEKTAHWLRDGGIEEEWDQYLSDLENMGLNDVISSWQAAYDRYQEALGK